MIDRAVAHVLTISGEPFAIQSFSPYGYDERQYCSPGFNLPVGVFPDPPTAPIQNITPPTTTRTLFGPSALLVR